MQMEWKIDDLRPLWMHAQAAPKRRLTFGQHAEIEGELGRKPTDAEAAARFGPSLHLVKDEGVYLMSNGAPAEMIERPRPNGDGMMQSCRVVYAKGFDPYAEDRGDVWDKARAAMGGDDSVEDIGADFWKQVFASNSATTLVIEATNGRFNIEVFW